jgi:hypothetical protein
VKTLHHPRCFRRLAVGVAALIPTVLYAWPFEFPIEIEVKNELPSAVAMTLIYDSGREREWSLAAGQSILMTRQHRNEVLTKLVVKVDRRRIQTCEIPKVKPKFTTLHIGKSGCWISSQR